MEIEIPAQTVSVDVGYEVVEQSLTPDSNGYVSITVYAPTGKKIVSASYQGALDYIDGKNNVKSIPASDGSSWYFEAIFGYPAATTPTLYLVCLAL